MTGSEDDSRSRTTARPWAALGLLLAIGATVALVFTADLRLLRLGIVAALWSALIAAFVAARNRRQARANEQAIADAQEAYERELEREVAARREHELEAETEARERVDAQAREELESLRSEVTALRDTLHSLFDGELLYERVALTAQSTRMRQFGDQDDSRVVSGQDHVDAAQAPAKQLTAKAGQEATERPTELLDRVPAKTTVRAQPNGAPTNSPVPPVNGAGTRQNAAPQKGAAQKLAAQQAESAQASPRQSGQQDWPTRRVAATASQAAKAARSTQQAGSEQQQAPAAQHPVQDGRQQDQPRGTGRTQAGPKQEPGSRARDTGPVPPDKQAVPARQAATSVQRDRAQEGSAERPQPPMRQAPRSASPQNASPPSGSAQPEPPAGHSHPPRRQQGPSAEPTVTARPVPPPAGTAAEPRPAAVRPAQRTDHKPPWDPGREAPNAGPQSGRRRRSESQAHTAQPAGPAHTARPTEQADTAQPEEASGSHATGRSVSELLAAHGGASSGTNRRRRNQE